MQSVTLTNTTATIGLTLPFVLPNGALPNSFTLQNATPGQYTFTVVDTCNNSRTVFFSVLPVDFAPIPVYAYIDSCSQFVITIDNAESAQLISTSTNFPFQLPYNLPIDPISGNPVLVFDQPGSFTFSSNSLCLDEPLVLSIEVPGYEPEFIVDQIPACNSTLKVSKRLTSFKVMQAPAAFPYPLPYDYSSLINTDGEILISGLPSGNYTLFLEDTCGYTTTKIITITNQITNTTSVIKNCGSFDVNLNFQTVPATIYTYYMQKLDPQSNNWVHPITNFYSSNINNQSAIVLINGQINYNFGVFGHFRIIGKRPQLRNQHSRI